MTYETTEREAVPPAERNAAWKATMDAESGRVRAECDRLDAVDGWGDPLEGDPPGNLPADHYDRVAIAEYAQAVRAENLERYQQEGVVA